MALYIHNLHPPITSEIGYLECSSEAASQSYMKWMRKVLATLGTDLQCKKVTGSFSERVLSLPPLVSVQSTRVLFLPTSSQWTGFLDNGVSGTDAFSVVSYLCQEINCRGLRVVSIDDTVRQTSTGVRGRYGATVLEVYSPAAAPGSVLNTQRAICASNDGGRWRFDAHGVPLECEDLRAYEHRSVRDRFATDHLARCLQYLGVPCTPSSFETPAPALLVSKNGPPVLGSKQYALEEVQLTF